LVRVGDGFGVEAAVVLEVVEMGLVRVALEEAVGHGVGLGGRRFGDALGGGGFGLGFGHGGWCVDEVYWG